MKVLAIVFKTPPNQIISMLQEHCRSLLLEVLDKNINTVHELKKVMMMQSADLCVEYPGAGLEGITFETSSHLTYEVFAIVRNGQPVVTLTARKKGFEFAFKDYDKALFN